LHERIFCKFFLLGALCRVVALQLYPYFTLSRQHIFVATRSFGAFKSASVLPTQTALLRLLSVLVSMCVYECVRECVCGECVRACVQGLSSFHQPIQTSPTYV
jgi:hypothetical protein